MIAGLRQRKFATLPELTAAIGERMEVYNAEPFQKRPGSRATVFAAEEQPLQATPYEISRWLYNRRVAATGTWPMHGHATRHHSHSSADAIRLREDDETQGRPCQQAFEHWMESTNPVIDRGPGRHALGNSSSIAAPGDANADCTTPRLEVERKHSVHRAEEQEPTRRSADTCGSGCGSLARQTDSPESRDDPWAIRAPDP